MSNGTFVGVDGTIYSVVGCRVHVTKFGFKTIDPYHPDFPLAMAALQSLIRPSLDPRAGGVLAMREVLDEDYIDGLRRCGYVSDQPWTRQS